MKHTAVGDSLLINDTP